MKKRFLKIICITVAAICILSGCSNTTQKENVSTTSSDASTTSSEDSSELVFDCTKLVKAQKEDVDKLLGITGTKGDNEPYIYNYGNDTAIFDDNGYCINLCLDLSESGYKIADEENILKKYGIDLTDSYYKSDSESKKHYTKLKNFQELDVIFDKNKDLILNIVFYPQGLAKLNNFVTNEKSKNTDSDSDSNDNSKETADSEVRSQRKNAGIVYDSNKSELYNDYCYEIANIGVRGDALVNSKDVSMADKTYSKYTDIINRLWGNLKSQLSESEFNTLYKEQKNWLDEKMSRYPTCDDPDGKFEDKIGAIQMTDERITVLLNYLQ